MLVSACQTHQKTDKAELETDTNDQAKRNVQQMQKEIIPAGFCRVMGTVVEIDSSLLSDISTDPCAKAPCRVKLRIDQILGYGSGFSQPMIAGSVIETFFAYSTADTRGLVKNLQHHFPGVQVGTVIQTDLSKKAQTLGQPSLKPIIYKVYGYQVI